MTAIEIDKEIENIILELHNECQGRLAEISKENRRERKAVQLELAMYSLGLRAGILYYTTGDKSSSIRVRNRRFENIINIFYPEIKKLYDNADDEEKLKLTCSLQCEAFLRSQMYDRYTEELKQAKMVNDMEVIFENTIKIGALDNMFNAYEEWRVSNNIYPHMFKVKGNVK
ncbi:MAG: hypothetical protein IJW19_08385 [Clostridia bacterium]|nr:hypothetical protein [Clostridia bacterium]